MSAIIIGAIIIGLVISLYIMAQAAIETKKRADEVVRRANSLIEDMDAVEGYLLALRDQLGDLTKTINEVNSNKQN